MFPTFDAILCSKEKGGFIDTTSCPLRGPFFFFRFHCPMPSLPFTLLLDPPMTHSSFFFSWLCNYSLHFPYKITTTNQVIYIIIYFEIPRRLEIRWEYFIIYNWVKISFHKSVLWGWVRPKVYFIIWYHSHLKLILASVCWAYRVTRYRVVIIPPIICCPHTNCHSWREGMCWRFRIDYKWKYFIVYKWVQTSSHEPVLWSWVRLKVHLDNVICGQ